MRAQVECVGCECLRLLGQASSFASAYSRGACFRPSFRQDRAAELFVLSDSAVVFLISVRVSNYMKPDSAANKKTETKTDETKSDMCHVKKHKALACVLVGGAVLNTKN